MIELKEISFAYPREKDILTNISLKIDKDERVGIVGVNGAGKSTLIKLLVGIYEKRTGSIKVDGIEVEKKNINNIRKKIGLIFQDSNDQLFMNTVYEDVAFGPKNLKLSNKEVDSRVIEALNLVGSKHLIDKMSFKLSGGEKRAVSIATVLAMRPKIIIMDEPTSFLDLKSRRCVINLLKEINYTKVIISHDLDFLLEVCDRIILLDKGKIIEDGKAEKVLLNKDLLERCGLELPISAQNCKICGRVKERW